MTDYVWTATCITAWLTWVAFAICMRRYFRRSRESNVAKAWLVRAAAATTVAQLATLALVRPPGLPMLIAALGCFALGHLLYWWALVSHGKERPAFACLPSAPATLNVAGPYAFVRHPIYAAYLFCWLAGPFATGQAWLLVPVAAMAALYYRAARSEERDFLGGSLADQYRDYRKRTGMFLPRVLPQGARASA